MFRTYKAEGIILKRVSVGEADRILTVFTRQFGKIRVLAKGVRKIASRRSPHMELFNHVRLVIYRGKTLDGISEIESLETFSACKEQLHRVAHGYVVAELVDRLLADGQEHYDIFARVLSIFRKLNTDAIIDSYSAAVHDFKIALLQELGYISDTQYAHASVDDVIEGIIEGKLRSTRFL